MDTIVIAAGKRTPQGRFLGSLARQSALDLALCAARAATQGMDLAAIDQVILGNVLGAGQGMNLARQVAVKLGMPITTPAFTVNMMCASGMQAVMLAGQAIRAGEARAVLCGGSESMSNAPYLLTRARAGYKLGNGELIDSLLSDGLTDAFDQKHMGVTAERLAQRYQITRQAQDELALRSQHKYQQAAAAGAFDCELAPCESLEADEHPRPDAAMEQLAKLKPVFDPAGSVTPGNASGINDGAAMLVVSDLQYARSQGWHPLTGLSQWTAVGCDPAVMGLGPVHAVRRLLKLTGCEMGTFDAIELNEAFAAQALACLKELDLSADDSRLNAQGGAIALGHPIGATGARLLVHLAHRIGQGHAKRALATLCVGGGMGTAVQLDRL